MSVRVESDQQLSPTPSANARGNLVWPSLLVALLATLGSLWLSVGMGLKACMVMHPRKKRLPPPTCLGKNSLR